MLHRHKKHLRGPLELPPEEKAKRLHPLFPLFRYDTRLRVWHRDYFLQISLICSHSNMDIAGAFVQVQPLTLNYELYSLTHCYSGNNQYIILCPALTRKWVWKINQTIQLQPHQYRTDVRYKFRSMWIYIDFKAMNYIAAWLQCHGHFIYFLFWKYNILFPQFTWKAVHSSV